MEDIHTIHKIKKKWVIYIISIYFEKVGIMYIDHK